MNRTFKVCLACGLLACEVHLGLQVFTAGLGGGTFNNPTMVEARNIPFEDGHEEPLAFRYLGGPGYEQSGTTAGIFYKVYG